MALMTIWVRLWILLLFLMNMGSVIFIDRLEGQVILAAMMLGGGVQLLIFSKLGFVRLLGLGHMQWFFMLVWLQTRTDYFQADPAIYNYIMILTGINSISLVIDVMDIGRYIWGERDPIVTLT